MMHGYAITLSPDDNDTVMATCDVLPELTTFGHDRGSAALRAIGAVEEALAARIAAWEPVPAPRAPKPGDDSFAPLAMQTLLKVELYRLMHKLALSRADLQRLLQSMDHKGHREQVDRLFRLDHASRLDQIEAGFKAIGAEIDVTVRGPRRAA